MKVGKITGIPFILYYQGRDEKKRWKEMEKKKKGKEKKKKERKEKFYLHI